MYRFSYLDVNYSINTVKKDKEYIIFSDNIIIPNEIVVESNF